MSNEPVATSLEGHNQTTSKLDSSDEPLASVNETHSENKVVSVEPASDAAMNIVRLLTEKTRAESAWLSQGKRRINSIRQLVEQSSEQLDKVRLLDELRKLEEQSAAARSEAHKLDQEIERETRFAAIKRQNFESRWKLFRQMLERESIASWCPSNALHNSCDHHRNVLQN